MPRPDVDGIRKILVLRFSSLGDVVMVTPALRALRTRFPTATIDMAVRSDCEPLVRHNPHLNTVWALKRGEGWRGLWRLVKQLNDSPYDLVYDAHRSLRSRLLLPLLRAPHKYRFRKRYLRRALALVFKFPLLEPKRFLERFVEPLHPLGVRYDGRGPELVVDEASDKGCLAKVPPVFFEGRPVAIIPSAQWPGKRWPLERFRTLVNQLVASTGHRIVVLGGPGDPFCEQVAQGHDPHRVVNLAGRLSLLESAAVLKRCRYTVANDTGLMHMADALGVPSVLIFGPTSAGLGCLPFHPKTRVVEQSLWCRPCSKNGQAPCIRGQRLCLTKTSVAQVLSAAQDLDLSLDQPAHPGRGGGG